MRSRFFIRRALAVQIIAFLVLAISFSKGVATPPANPPQPTFNFYFGNLHSHTSYLFHWINRLAVCGSGLRHC